jgi:hypothetical protein
MKSLIKNSKGFLDMPFTWIFAIIVGVVILFFAFYFSRNLVQTSTSERNAKNSQEIQTFLNSIENKLENSQISYFSLPNNVILRNICEDFGLGKQKLSSQEKTFKGDEIKTILNNKYIFSQETIESKDFVVFSKSLKLGFDLANLIYFIPKNKEYCFIDAPYDLKKEINELNISNLKTGSCNGTKVCFNRNENCDIFVDYPNNKLITINGSFSFGLDEDNALFYATLFSDKNIYECQLKRLIERAKILTNVYIEKQGLLNEYCENSITDKLNEFYTHLNDYKDSQDISMIVEYSKELNEVNKNSECRLW